MNKFERACREFLKGCSNGEPPRQEGCHECLDEFIHHIKKIGGDEQPLNDIEPQHEELKELINGEKKL